MSVPTIPCPECNRPVGPGVGIDLYKHALNCLNVSPGPIDRLTELYQARGDEHGRRVVALLHAAAAGPKE